MAHESMVSRILCIVALASVMATSTSLHACLARSNIPKMDKPGQHHAVFIATIASYDGPPGGISVTDTTPSYSIRLFPDIRILHGAAPAGDLRKIRDQLLESDGFVVMGGCGEPVPTVGEVGLFFQRHPGKYLSPLDYFRPGSERLQQYSQRIFRARPEQNP